MTIDEVKRCIDEGSVIVCDDLGQRDEALQFLVDSLGYKIHSETIAWMERNPGSTSFINPGLDVGTPRLTLWSASANKPTIAFSIIAELIAQNDVSIDERDVEEFSEAFMVLIS